MGAITETVKKNALSQMTPSCNVCKNHIGGLKCKAFDVIPDEIIFGEIKHNKPLKNQENNIVFEPINPKK